MAEPDSESRARLASGSWLKTGSIYIKDEIIHSIMLARTGGRTCERKLVHITMLENLSRTEDIVQTDERRIKQWHWSIPLRSFKVTMIGFLPLRITIELQVNIEFGKADVRFEAQARVRMTLPRRKGPRAGRSAALTDPPFPCTISFIPGDFKSYLNTPTWISKRFREKNPSDGGSLGFLFYKDCPD
ncbi:hypothetical protein EVAR_48786_1 [Eumeta japonica]|uniref:Uncharacterized protein n=1 Tax=Eumeta variegata TaxID=151549 RepID=A0A4C1Y1L5_EUMVA|nr:hypothetical protein EVAR_48786_1 [Eumeta japonica]